MLNKQLKDLQKYSNLFIIPSNGRQNWIVYITVALRSKTSTNSISLY